MRLKPRFWHFDVVALVLIAASAAAQTNPDPAGIGRKALHYLLAERFPELTTMFDAAMKENLTLDVLRARVSSELGSFGKAESVGDGIVSRDNQLTLVTFPVTFTKTKVNVLFHIHESGELAAIHFRPADSPAPATWQRPVYSKPDAFREQAITIGSDPWKLGGTLTMPKGEGRFPAVFLVHGPGPNDRDESMRANKVFADIAEGLSSRGIVVLRYDKRTLVYGRQMSQHEFTLREETIDDALAAEAFLRSQPQVDPSRIFLLGHSLGGYAAPRIAREDGKLAGVIFLAANARPIQDLIREQTQYLAAAGALPPEEAQKRLDSLAVETEKLNALAVGKDNPPVVLGLPSAWLLDVKSYDPAAEAARLSIPLLFLQGGRDFQVSMTDFERWKATLRTHPNATFKSFPDLNHLFISGKAKSVPAEYLIPSNVSADVITTISDWIAASKN
jgi:fermentation-respiration switch protein FrsA (DUF1100 family)